MVEKEGVDNQCVAFVFEKTSVRFDVKLSFSTM